MSDELHHLKNLFRSKPAPLATSALDTCNDLQLPAVSVRSREVRNERERACFGLLPARFGCRLLGLADGRGSTRLSFHDGLLYLVSGGGGAKPSAITRSAADRYQDPQFPNFHYLRFELDGERLKGEMHRLTDFNAAAPGAWAINDRFELSATPSRR